MKKIALVIDCTTDFGGAERRLIRIYDQIGKEIRCDLAFRGCTDKEARKRLKNADCGTKHIDQIICFDNTKDCWKYFWSCGKKYDMIHFIDICGFNFGVSLIGKIKRFKTLYTIALVPDAYDIFHNKICARMKILLKLVSSVDVLYPWAYENLIKNKKDGNVFVTPGTYTDLKVFFPKTKKNLLVYAAARLEPLKNPGLLIEACLLCKEDLRAKGYKVILLGKGVLEEELKDKIAKNQMEDIMLMPGYQKTSAYFPYAKGVFSLQTQENYPSQVIAEAAASGCFLMISDVGYSRKTAEESFSRFVKNDAKDLSDAIKEYINLDEQEQKTMSENARKYALEKYDIKTSVRYFKNILFTISGKKDVNL